MTELQEPQVLSSFNTEAIAELRGAIDPREVLVRAQQYPTLRMLLEAKDIKQKIGESLVKNDPEMLRGLLLGIFNEARTYKRQEMTEVPAGEPFAGEAAATAPKLTTQEYVARIAETESASRLVIEQRKTAKRHEFAQKLTENFIKQTRQTITEDQKQIEVNRIEQGLSLDWYRNKAEITNTLRQSYLGGPTYQGAVDRVAKIASVEADRIASSEARFEAVITAAASSIAADEVVVHRPDVFLKIAAVQAERSTKAPVVQIIDRAAALERATVGFTGNEEELPLQLSALAKTPVQKLVAGVVDILPEGPREAIVAGIVGGAWEKAVDTATQYYGQQIVNNDWFQQALTHGNQGLTNTKSALQSLTGGAQKVLADVAVTVFRGEMDEATLAYVENVRQHTALPTMASAIFRGPAGETTVAPTEARRPIMGAGTAGGAVVAPTRIGQPVTAAGIAGTALRRPAGEMVVTQTEMVRQYIVTMGPVSYQQFYAAAVYGHNPGLLSYGLSLGLRYGTRKATQALTKAVAKKAATAAITEGGAAAVGTALAPGVGTLIGLAVSFGVDLLKNIFNKGVGFFKSLVGMGTSKNPEDNLLLVGAAALALVFFLPIFPLFNLPAFNQSMIDASLATSLGVAGPGGPEVPGAPEGELVIWSYGGTAPITSSSQLGCPVRGGTITQGPNGSFSHQGIQAYDFANSMGAPIYATHDAYVVSFRDGIAPYTFLNHSYGNYVLLAGQLPSGSKFFTIYGHLLSVDPLVPAALSGTRSSPCKNNDPKLICAGEIIGYEDATGSTWGGGPGGTGIHLHYQSQGLGALVLPPGCP